MTFSGKALLGLVIAAALAVGAFAGYRWLKGRQVAVHLKAADQLDVQQAAAGTQAVTHEQAAAAIAPVLQSDDSRVAQDRAALAKLQHPAPVPAPGTHDSAPAAQPVPPPVDVAALDAAKDQLIADLTKANADLKAALVEETAADSARQVQVKALLDENQQLRAALAVKPKDLHWGIAAIKGTAQTVGAGVEYDWGVVRVGTDLVRHQTAGGQVSIEAVGRLVIRF